MKINFMEFFINLGTKSGLPRYLALIGLLQSGILFVPEVTWVFLGVDARLYIQNCPVFIQYYVNNSSFMNAMFAFWLMSPFTFLISSILWFVHINIHGYQGYLVRRASRLKKQEKTSDYSLVLGALVFLVAYVWATGIYLIEPGILGNFVPAKNRLVMLIVHAGAIALLLPASLTILIAELRANLFESKFFKR